MPSSIVAQDREAAIPKPIRTHASSLLLASLCTGCVALWPADERPVSPVAVEARRIMANLKETKYQFTIVADESRGLYQMDCSGLAGYILKRVAPEAHAAAARADRAARPRAFAFYETFARAPAEPVSETQTWMRIARLADARAGDMIAWRKPVLKAGETTGHIVIVDSHPVKARDGRWRVRIIDATTRGHDRDTRKEVQTGVGCGTMWFTVDEEGRPNGTMSRYSSPPRTNQPIAIGRVVPRGMDPFSTPVPR